MALVSPVVIILTSLQIITIFTTATSENNSGEFYSSHIFINLNI